VKIHLPKSKWCPESKVQLNVLNLSDKAKILELLKSVMSLAEVGQSYRENETSICSTVVNPTHPEHSWVFLNDSLLGSQGSTIHQFYVL
jgi:hypothetical protein